MSVQKKMYFGMLIGISALLVMDVAKPPLLAQTKPLTLRWAYMGPPTGVNGQYIQKAADEVKRVTEGRVQVDIYWSESLVKVKETPRAVQKGLCQIGYVLSPYNSTDVPLWTHFQNILYIPRGDDCAWIANKYWELWDTCQPLRTELEKIGQTAWYIMPYDSYVLYSKKPVSKLEDMRGMRIRVSGEGYAKMVSAIGAAPVFLPASDTYSAIERGTVDGALAGWAAWMGYKLYEVSQYAIELNVFVLAATHTVSLAALNKIPGNDKEGFIEVGRRVSLEAGEASKREREACKQIVARAGVKITPFPSSEREKWANLPQVKNLIKDWMEEQNKAGRPGTEVMNAFLRIFEVNK